MVEKPIAHTLDEAQAIHEAVQRNNVMFMVAQVLRFWPEYVYLKQVYLFLLTQSDMETRIII